MRIGIFQLVLGREVGCYTPSRNPELGQHSGVRWARVFRVRWRRINQWRA